MSIVIHKSSTNQLSENSHHKHFTKLPELKIKNGNNYNEYTPIRRKRFVPSFKSPEETHKIIVTNENSIGRVNTFNQNLSNLKGNNELFLSTDRELSPYSNIRKTKSILKKNSLVNNNNEEHEHEHEHEQHKSVKFAFDENNQPLKTVFLIDNNKNKIYLENDKNIDDSENINEKKNQLNKEICKCESYYIF